MKKKTAALYGYVVALHVVLAGLLWHTLAPSSDAWPLMLKIQAQMDPFVPDGAAIFLGDSITQALATAAVAPLSVNYGISGQRSDQLLRAMASYHSLSRARVVVVMIGTNDAHQHRLTGIAGRYRAILAAVPAGVPVVMASAPPVVGVDVTKAVRGAEQACAERAGCVFADTFSALSAPGAISEDGMHPSAKGYALLIDLLRHAINTAGKAHPSAPVHMPPPAH